MPGKTYKVFAVNHFGAATVLVRSDSIRHTARTVSRAIIQGRKVRLRTDAAGPFRNRPVTITLDRSHWLRSHAAHASPAERQRRVTAEVRKLIEVAEACGTPRLSGRDRAAGEREGKT